MKRYPATRPGRKGRDHNKRGDSWRSGIKSNLTWTYPPADVADSETEEAS